MFYTVYSYFVSWTLFFNVNSQFHLYHTYDPMANLSLFFDCLYYKVLDDTIEYEVLSMDFKRAVQHIPYCIRPDFTDSSANNEEENNPIVNGNNMSFDHMQKIGVTVHDLLVWSAPIDIVELYQDFLQYSTNGTSFPVFYNCTWPWFGPKCQYTFDAKNVQSFNSIVRNTFVEKLPINSEDYHYPPWFNNLTCYTHLTCNRGPKPLCLDWREICDGQIDCLDDGIDEIGCSRLYSNICEKDEFRCDNGMCVPLIFRGDSPYNFDCMDASDEKYSILGQSFVHCISEPAFRCEELAYIESVTHLFCGDGQTCDPSILNRWCCRNGRSAFLHEVLMSRAANKHIVDDACWFVMYCAINAFENIIVDCTSLCPRHSFTCQFNIKRLCNTPYIVFPQTPILPGYFHSIYRTNKTIVHVKEYVLYTYMNNKSYTIS